MEPTADLSDRHPHARVAAPLFRDYGGLARFSGPISTVKVFEDNVLVRIALEEPGAGRVLVVDGGASARCALVGDRLATIARDNGWAGIVVYGYIRDSQVIATIDIGLKAIGTHPRRSVKRGLGQRDVRVDFAGIYWRPGDRLHADPDGIVLLDDAPSDR